jgi:uncharacterized protein (TIGR00369 family)
MMERGPDYYIERDASNLPGILGIRPLEIGKSHTILEMDFDNRHANYRGYIHGGSVVTLADTAAGYGTYSNLPVGAHAFATLELKCNFIRAINSGTLSCRADCIHQGKTTQVWDATVTSKEDGKTIAAFRCTQMILYPEK